MHLFDEDFNKAARAGGYREGTFALRWNFHRDGLAWSKDDRCLLRTGSRTCGLSFARDRANEGE